MTRRDPLGAGEGAAAPEAGEEPVMPSPSWRPLAVSAGILLTAVGALTELWVVGLGVLVIFYGVFSWAYEPVH